MDRGKRDLRSAADETRTHPPPYSEQYGRSRRVEDSGNTQASSGWPAINSIDDDGHEDDDGRDPDGLRQDDWTRIALETLCHDRRLNRTCRQRREEGSCQV